MSSQGGNPMSLFRALTRGMGAAMLGLSLVFAAANAQAPSLVQPWGLPPLPAGVGPVEKFADVSGTPQGQFLEGGSVDTQGKSMVRSDRQRLGVIFDTRGEARPGVQLQPAARAGSDLRATGYALARRQALLD